MLRRLSLSLKILLLCSTFMIPIGYLAFNMVTAFNKDIVFAHTELQGSLYLKTLVAMLEDLSMHRLASERVLNGEESQKEALAKAQTQVDKHFAELRELNTQLADDLQLTDDGLHKRKRDHLTMKAFGEEWERLKRELPTLKSTAANEQNQHLIGDIRGMITHVGDTSFLILDPDLDSYYIMDAVLCALPQMQDRLQTVISYALGVAHRKQVSVDERIQLAIYGSSLKEADLDRVGGDVDTALNEDPNFNGKNAALQKNMPSAMAAAAGRVEPFINMVHSLHGAETTDVKPEAVLETGMAALSQSFRLWAESSERMDELLEVRVKGYEAQKFRAFWGSIVGLAFFMLVIFLVTRRIAARLVSEVVYLKQEANETQTSSIQLSNCSEVLTSTGSQQAAAIQETIAAVAEIGSMVAQTANQAKTSQEIASKVSEKTNEGGRIMDAMVHSMESIEEANSQLQSISSIIGEISAKTNVINDIVFKTQLLSFNASIEAARAGQHGRGFAVVAEEVGNLAQMSGNAAKEIRSLLEDSQKQVAGIVDSTHHRVSEGKHVSQQAQSIFVEIAREINSISSQVQSVSEASQEQKLGIEQISKAMSQMDDTTKANGTTARQSSRLSRDLKQQSQKLTGIATHLDSLIQGKKSVKSPVEGSPEARAAEIAPRKVVALKIVPQTEATAAAEVSAATLENLANRAATFSGPSAGPTVEDIPTADDGSFERRAG